MFKFDECPHHNMKSVRRNSVSEPFAISPNEPIPETPDGGARVKVHYCGACYTDSQVKLSGRRPKGRAILDTSLFPGFEVSGIVDSIGRSVDTSTCHVKPGDKVIIYPDAKESPDQGYNEFIVIKDVKNLVKIPDNLQMQVAATLPSGALTAYSAIYRLKPSVQEKIDKLEGKRPVHILIVGAGALALWTIRMVRHLLPKDPKLVHLSVGDTSIDHLDGAISSGADEAIHWDETVHEENLIARTKSVCCDGVDIIIDYSSAPRTVNRSFEVLGHEGVLVVGGHCQYDIPVDLNSLARKQQNILGVSNGSRTQLETIVRLVAAGEIEATHVSVFPVAEANRVFQRLNSCEIAGRPVLEVCPY